MQQRDGRSENLLQPLNHLHGQGDFRYQQKDSPSFEIGVPHQMDVDLGFSRTCDSMQQVHLSGRMMISNVVVDDFLFRIQVMTGPRLRRRRYIRNPELPGGFP